jgi:hypothetical protein
MQADRFAGCGEPWGLHRAAALDTMLPDLHGPTRQELAGHPLP